MPLFSIIIDGLIIIFINFYETIYLIIMGAIGKNFRKLI